MNAAIARQLRVKGGGENSPLTNQHRVITPAPEHLNGLIAPCDSRGADEDPLHPRGITEGRREVDLGNFRKDLASVSVSLDIDPEHPEAVLMRHDRLGENDDTRTSCEDRHPLLYPFNDPAGEIFGLHQPKHRR